MARNNDQLKPPAASLLYGKELSTLTLLGQNQPPINTKGSYIQLTVPAQEKIGMRADFSKTIDLNHNDLILYLKKAPVALKVGLVIKDSQFYSNSLNPLIIDLPQDNNVSYTKIPMEFKNTFLQNTNLGKIKQISIYFYPQDKEKAAWVLIKDLVLVKKDSVKTFMKNYERKH